MKKLLIGAMMASLFMMGSDADAFSFFGLKKKSASTSDLATSSNNSSTNLKRSKSDSELVVKKVKKTQAENIDDFIDSMGKYFESSALFISVQLSGWESGLKSISSSPTYFGKGLTGPANRNAQKNVKAAIKALNKTNGLIQKLLKGNVSDADAAVNSVTTLQESLLSLVGSNFWKCFGNHIRYSLINVRNSLNALLFPDLYWNVGNILFSMKNGSEGVEGEGNIAGRYLGSDSFEDPSEPNEDSPVLRLRNAFNELINKLLDAEGLKREEKQKKKSERQESLARGTAQAKQKLKANYEKTINGKKSRQEEIEELRNFSKNLNVSRGKMVSIDDENEDDYDDSEAWGQ